MSDTDPFSLALFLALLALVPLIVVMTTSFLKIAVVLALVRNALGVQQVPPNMALYGLALILSAYVMAPVVHRIGTEVQALTAQAGSPAPPRRWRWTPCLAWPSEAWGRCGPSCCATASRPSVISSCAQRVISGARRHRGTCRKTTCWY